jgi:hypothetical protein
MATTSLYASRSRKSARRDDLVQQRNGIGPKDSQRRVVERRTPVKRHLSLETDLLPAFHAHVVACDVLAEVLEPGVDAGQRDDGRRAYRDRLIGPDDALADPLSVVVADAVKILKEFHQRGWPVRLLISRHAG